MVDHRPMEERSLVEEHNLKELGIGLMEDIGLNLEIEPEVDKFQVDLVGSFEGDKLMVVLVVDILKEDINLAVDINPTVDIILEVGKNLELVDIILMDILVESEDTVEGTDLPDYFLKVVAGLDIIPYMYILYRLIK